MALIDTGPGYTRTGNGTLTKWANIVSGIPILRSIHLDKIPFIGGSLNFVIGSVDTIIESGGYLLRGQFGSAATAAVAGTVSNAVNATESIPFFWLANDASALITGATLGTHARKLTEEGIGMATGALGIKPTVLRSYTAGLGSMGDMPTASARAPGQFTTKIANERGYADADAYYAQKSNGEAGSYVSPSLTGQASVA